MVQLYRGSKLYAGLAALSLICLTAACGQSAMAAPMCDPAGINALFADAPLAVPARIDDLCSSESLLEPQTASLSARVTKAAIDAKATAANDNKVDRSINWSPWVSSVAARWAKSLTEHSATCTIPSSLKPSHIRFTCNRWGKLESFRVTQSCGATSLDREHLKALIRCSPLPKFPKGTSQDSITLVFVWEYQLSTDQAAEQQSGRTAARK